MSKAELHVLRAPRRRNSQQGCPRRVALRVAGWAPWDTAERRSPVSFAAIFAPLTLGRGSNNSPDIIFPRRSRDRGAAAPGNLCLSIGATNAACDLTR